MTDREAMKQALEALEMCLTLDTPEEMHLLETDIAPKAIVALKLAIEQTEKQEPAAWVHPQALGQDFIAYSVQVSSEQIPLYTTPPKPELVGLTDEEIESIMWYMIDRGEIGGTRLSRTIEAKLKEKNHG
jgi:hypothetical protein